MLDIDICGPSIPKVFGCEGEQVHHSNSGWSPVVSPRSSHFGVVGVLSGHFRVRLAILVYRVAILVYRVAILVYRVAILVYRVAILVYRVAILMVS